MNEPTPFPSDFRPTKASDFIGSAGTAALAMERLVARSLPGGRSSAHLFIGQPGVGKSSLCEFAAHVLLGVPVGKIRGHYNVQFRNGKDVTADVVRELRFDLHHTNMLGDWRVIWIDEVDKLTNDAQVLMLSLLDDLPKRCLVLCTSNEDFSGPTKEQRFQSRFTVWQVGPPEPAEIGAWLASRFKLGAAVASSIATTCCGDVRAALKDADAVSLVAA